MLTLRHPRAQKHSNTTEDLQQLELFLLGNVLAAPHADVLRRHKLAAFAYAVLPEAEFKRSGLHGDFVFASMNHLKVKASLKPLFELWADVFVDVMVFKGFFLAEFLYDVPAKRSYGDVDLLVDAADIDTMVLQAESLGWRVSWRAGVENGEAPATHVSHEVLHLEHETYPIRLDVHAQVTHVVNARQGVQSAVTEAVWQQAEVRDWEGVQVLTPSLVDSVLVGLVMSRSWSADNWVLKAQDYLDFDLLIANGVTENDLFARAQELNCNETLKLFLKRCNPFKQSLSLEAPTQQERLMWESQIVLERGSPRLDRFLVFFRELVVDCIWMLPSFMLAIYYVFNALKVEALFAEESASQPIYEWRLLRLKRAARVYLSVSGLRWLKPEPLFSLMLFVSLRRLGCKAHLEQSNKGLELRYS